MSVMMVMGIIAMGAGFIQMIPPLARGMQYGANWAIPNNIPDVVGMAELTARGFMPKAEYVTAARILGFSSAWAERILENAGYLLSAVDYVSLWRRGELGDEQLAQYATLLKISSDELERVKKASEFFPAPQDLIRFAVREVYTPSVIEAYGMAQDLPEQFLQEAAKVGVPDQQAKNYWASHWQLPSYTEGTAMLQRGIITKDDTSLLLKTLDYMPYWRDKLIQLAYNPLTRVDVRRMYGLGILNEEQVTSAFMAAGYSPEHAQYLTEFTIKYENKEMDGLTRANVLKAYKDEVISREELVGYLKAFGYVEAVVEFWSEMADYEKTVEAVSVYTNDLVDQFLAGGRSIESVRAELDAADLPSTYVEQVIRKTVIQRAKKVKIPDRADLTAWLKSNLITEVVYVEKMRLHGFREEDIERYLTMIADTINTAEKKSLPLDTYKRWYKKGIISETRFREILTEQNYSEEDATLLIAELRESSG
jgi:hypothetical protein